ncbi:MAG: hypothetical protein Q9222_004224 [Ikaeria aurantiellina]
MPGKRKAEQVFDLVTKWSIIKQKLDRETDDSSLHKLLIAEAPRCKLKKKHTGGRLIGCKPKRKERADRENSKKAKEFDADELKHTVAFETLIQACPNEKQSLHIEISRPAGLINMDLACFANTGIQALDCVEELREQLLIEAQSPANGLISLREHRSMVKTGQPSLALRLGQAFQDMNAAAQSGISASLYNGFLKTFGTLHPGYNGSIQQEVFDFIEKTLQQLADEESGVCGPDSTTLVTRLFGGQMSTRVPEDKETIPLEDCLKAFFAPESPEDFTCPGCNKKDTTVKEIVNSWSTYLILNCSRAGIDGKIQTKIRIPSHIALDKYMADYKPPTIIGEEIASDCFPSLKHEIMAFAQHRGVRIDKGRYDIVRRKGNEWFHCDDGAISLVDKDEAFAARRCTVVILKRSSS